MFDDMNMTRYIRLIACVGAYLLLRPYFVKIGTKIQEKEFEKQSQAARAKDPYEAATIADGSGKKKISPNSLREGGGGKKTVSFEGDKKEEVEATGKEWGGKARLRQKRVVDGLLEVKEKRLREDDEEEKKDVLELLKDYDSGEDGW